MSGDDLLRQTDQGQTESEAALRRDELQLKREALRQTGEIESKRLALQEEEMKHKQREVDSQPFWKTTSGVAILGGALTIVSALLSNFIQGWNSTAVKKEETESQIKLERQKLQAQLIQK